jgi:transcriptional regulator with GAF, ATPase, and Fis domain
MESKRKLEIISHAIQEINSSLNLETVMDLIYKNIKELMDVSFFIISSYDKKNMQVSIEYCVKQGKSVKEEFTTTIHNSTSLTAWAIKNNCEIIINDLEKDYGNYLPGKPQLHGKEDLWCESIIMIPLRVKNELIGLFSVQNQFKNSYTDSDIELLRLLSSLISTALNNSGIYKKLDEANIEISKQKALIEEKNKDILSSIRYAKRIQTSLLPTEKYIDRILNNTPKNNLL